MKYDCIVIDPPWPMTKIRRNVRPRQVGFDYPTMSIKELEAFKTQIDEWAADDCHLFCWTTVKYLPPTLKLVELWGFQYEHTMVWHKNGGFQPFGLPQYNAEFVVYGRRGSPQLINAEEFCWNSCFFARRRQHSRKPDEFYDIVKRHTTGRRIDVFSREKRDGFDRWGNEVDKFNEPFEQLIAA